MFLDWLLDTFTHPPVLVRPSRGVQHFYRETLVRAPLEGTFAFFADASNLDVLTPPWLKLPHQDADARNNA